jgi:hypothetical protein
MPCARYRNKKNGNVYLRRHDAIDCTNSRDGTPVVVYAPEARPDELFVREMAEFLVKFEPLDDAPLDPPENR